MIQDENKRMSHQVEKILQMATLEEGDYELNLTLVDVHDLIVKATDAILIRVQGRGGTLERHLNASKTIISGDPVHLSSMIHNLLDNALKYTPDTPVITVTTENENHSVVIRIADTGIGIPDTDKVMVFEKYYRVSTGNVHNVKGFGIGLSYVKLMTEAHKGRVILESELGKGTRISLVFPLVDDEVGRE
jgi:two-component system phosphate regulon sensor histidine kinase PhoR